MGLEFEAKQSGFMVVNLSLHTIILRASSLLALYVVSLIKQSYQQRDRMRELK